MQSIWDRHRSLLLKYPPIWWPNIAVKYALCLGCFAARLPAVSMVSGNLNTTWFDANTPTGQHGKWYEKYSLHLIFTFYLNRDTSATELFPVVVLKKKKKKSRVDSFTDNESKPSRIVVERSETMLILIHIIADQNSYHDDKSAWQCFTRVFCPQLIRNMRSRRRIDSASIIALPVNFYSGRDR